MNPELILAAASSEAVQIARDVTNAVILMGMLFFIYKIASL